MLKFVLIAVIIIVVIIIAANYESPKKKAEKAAAAAKKAEEEKKKAEEAAKKKAEQERIAAEKKALRDSRLVNGEPVDCPNVPEIKGEAEKVKTANGKTYLIPTSDEYQYFNGIWDPFFRLITAERYGERLHQRLKDGENLTDNEIRAMVDCLLYAAEAYAYGRATGDDLYIKERSMLRRISDRARALTDDGYYHLAYPKQDLDKARRYYSMLDAIPKERRTVLSITLRKRLYCASAESAHLMTGQTDSVTASLYQFGFTQIEGDKDAEEFARLDVVHAMMDGYPRNPKVYEEKMMKTVQLWAKYSYIAVAFVKYDLQDGYCNLSNSAKRSLASSPEEAVKVYREGAAEGNIYCMYMLGRCTLYGYGMEADVNAAREILEEAARSRCVSAMILLMRMSADDPNESSLYNKMLQNTIGMATLELMDNS